MDNLRGAFEAVRISSRRGNAASASSRGARRCPQVANAAVATTPPTVVRLPADEVGRQSMELRLKRIMEPGRAPVTVGLLPGGRAALEGAAGCAGRGKRSDPAMGANKIAVRAPPLRRVPAMLGWSNTDSLTGMP